MKKRLSITQRNAITGRLFCLPFYIGLLLFFLVPLIQSFCFSFEQVTTQIGYYKTSFVGFENFIYAFRVDADYRHNLTSSVIQLLYQVPVIIISSLFFSLILNQKFKGRLFVRAIFFLPVIVASGVVIQVLKGDAVAGMIVQGSAETQSSIFSGSVLQNFLINSGLNSDIVKYFTQISSNLFDMLWRTGIQMLMFLAGLQSISPSLYEASAIEGATAWENFWMITLPKLSPILLVNIIYTIVDSFTDPDNVAMAQIMKQFTNVEYGKGAAMAWTYFITIGFILACVMFVFSRFDNTKKPERRK